MSKPHKCPVCDGQGIVSRPPNVAGDRATWAASDTCYYPCRACSGTGIIWEHEAVSIPSAWTDPDPDVEGVPVITTTLPPGGQTTTWVAAAGGKIFDHNGDEIPSTPT